MWVSNEIDWENTGYLFGKVSGPGYNSQKSKIKKNTHVCIRLVGSFITDSF